jgi:LysR family transcriptional regulator, low CO2-responsive transcriptional regulator
MNHSQLRAFYLVAREGSFTRAAQASGLGQPNLSGQVKALEAAHGVRLFDRRGRGVHLTELGRELYTVTDRLFAVEAEAEAVLTGGEAAAVRRLRVSADHAAHAIPVMAALKQRHPAVQFSLSVGNSETVLRDLIEYRADVAVMAKPAPAPRFHTLPFRRDRVVLYVPKAHAWSRRRGVPLPALAGQDMVLREVGSATREAFETARREAGVTLGAVLTVEGREAVEAAVAAGFGIGIVFARELARDGRFVPIAIRDAALDVAEYVACLEDRRRLPAVRAFLEIAAAMKE